MLITMGIGFAASTASQEAPDTSVTPFYETGFDNADGWTIAADWSIGGSEASKIAGATNHSATLDLAIPAGAYVLSFDIVSSDSNTGLLPGLRTENVQEVFYRGAVATHAIPYVTGGSTQIRFLGRSSWTGSIDNARLYAMDAINALPADIYILAGQSNMEGGSAGSPDLTADTYDPRVSYLAAVKQNRYGSKTDELRPAVDPLQHASSINGGVGPGMAFAKAMQATLTGRRVVLVSVAQGGTDLSDWNALTGANYATMVTQAQAALALCPAGSEIKGLIWSQGEADRTPTVDVDYPPQFAEILSNLRADLAAPAMGCVILGPTPDDPMNDLLRAGQATLDQDSGDANAIAGVKYIELGAGYAVAGDIIHFTAEGNRLRGAAAAAAMRIVAPGAAPSSAILTEAGDTIIFENGDTLILE